MATQPLVRGNYPPLDVKLEPEQKFSNSNGSASFSAFIQKKRRSQYWRNGHLRVKVMRAFGPSEFVTEISKTSNKAYMMISMAPELVSYNSTSYEQVFKMLDREAVYELTVHCAVTIVFDTIDEAILVFTELQNAQRAGKLPHLELMAQVTYQGYTQLVMAQDPEMEAFLVQENDASHISV